jgi:hypothetical protein
MNIFDQLYGIMFAIGLILFISDPVGFIKESERVVSSPGPKIVNGHFGIPKRSHRHVARSQD